MPQYKPIMDFFLNDVPLERFLEDHKRWVETKGIEGERAVLSGGSLGKANLEYADLRAAILAEVDLGEANLMNVTLRGAKLPKAALPKSNLKWAILRYRLKGRESQRSKSHRSQFSVCQPSGC